MTMNRRVTVALVTALTLLLAACGGTGRDGSGSGATKDTLTIGMSSPPVSLDPSKAATGLYLLYSEPTYASLIERDGEGKLVPGLADSWGYVGAGNTTFEVTLREGVKWADGSPIAAQDVVASLEYFSKGSGPAAPYLKGMSFTAKDQRTVTITSPQPTPVIPDLLAPENLAGAIISPAGLKDPAKLAANTFGAGPYVFDAAKSVSGDHYVFTPNKNYYDQSAVHFTSITVKVIPNVNSAVQALKSGQIDLMSGNADAAGSVQGDAAVKVTYSPTVWAGLFLLDRAGTVVPALKDVRVRQALNYGIDRKAITTAVYGTYGRPLAQPAIPGTDGYSETAEGTYTYDPAKARQLLADAGYAGGLTIPVNYGSFDPDNAKLVQAVQGQLAEVGVTLKLTGASNFGGWVNDLVSRKYAATVLSPGSGGSAYFIAQSSFMPGGIMNVFGVEDGDLSAAFRALSTAPQDQRTTAAQKITDVAVEHALALPVAAGSTIVLHNSRLDGVHFIPGAALTSVSTWTYS
jgi:peptide/nickel transport system substrate-binding protein